MKSSHKKDKAYLFGLLAEFMASCWLRLRRYKIIETRYKTPVGEIDIIARKGGTLVFIEVKGRKTLSTALACLTPRMRQRISRAAALYISHNPKYAGMDMRFDLIVMAPPFYGQHLDNAWQADS